MSAVKSLQSGCRGCKDRAPIFGKGEVWCNYGPYKGKENRRQVIDELDIRDTPDWCPKTRKSEEE